MISRLVVSITTALTLMLAPTVAHSQQGSLSDTYTTEEIVAAGHGFFGGVAEGLGALVERAMSQYGQPNAYILGQEGSGAFFIGARYGDGTMYTRNAGNHPLFWQGPSLGLNFGGGGSRVMMLVYNLPTLDAIYDRFPGVEGSIYAVGGFGMSALRKQYMYVVPITAGLGLKAGVSVGYVNFTREPTWNPF